MLGHPEGRERATPIFGEKLIIWLKVDIFKKFLLHRIVLDPGKLFKMRGKNVGPLGGVAGPRPFLDKKIKNLIKSEYFSKIPFASCSV